MTSNELEKFVRSPSEHFPSPQAVVDHPDLEKQDKVRILKSWKEEEMALQRATEESMDGGERPEAGAVEDALIQLDAADDD